MADFDLETIKHQMLRKYPAFGSTIANVKYQLVDQDHWCPTACTDGDNIIVNTDWISHLPPEDQLFVFAHEVCHIALNHCTRVKGKNPEVWNIATDAVVNQHLQEDGLLIPNGMINIPEAINHDAEEMYKRLLKDQKQQQQWKDGGLDNHSQWGKSDKQNDQGEQDQPVSEKEAFAENKRQREEKASQVMQKLRNMRQGFDRKTSFKDLGNAKPVMSWKKILRQALEIEDEAWGHKFSDHTNNYTARIQDVEYDEKAETEIILDVSGSVSENLLRNFLRQVKTILRDSDIKVGTFSTGFHGFQPVKRTTDIDNIRLPIGGFTNFDAASCAFTKRKDVNKICFTDGDYTSSVPIKEKRKDIIWISFENPNFKPDLGKVIFIPQSQLKALLQAHEQENELTR